MHAEAPAPEWSDVEHVFFPEADSGDNTEISEGSQNDLDALVA